MAKISPFKALRPYRNYAKEVATLPYDVCSLEEARKFKNYPNHFYHITRSEIDLPEDIDVHSQKVYEKAAENLNDMIERDILFHDDNPYYYIYQLEMQGRQQSGLVCCSSVDDYKNNIIKKHEFTRPEKEKDRINHIKTTQAQTGVVFLAYKNVDDIDAVIESWKKNHEPEYDFVSEDEIRHTIWIINDQEQVSNITHLFDTKVPFTYIADGHHRAASAAKVAQDFKESSTNTNQFLTCIFPSSQLSILDYNRVVKHLNGLSKSEFIQKLSEDFDVQLQKEIFKPKNPHEFGLYIDGEWYQLIAKDGTFDTDPISILDVSILQNNILHKILGISDPRTDTNIDFVGGIRGLEELEKRVNSGEMAAAFACYPVSIQQLFDVADSGNVMPPKSTWFEPKTRDGLLIYTF